MSTTAPATAPPGIGGPGHQLIIIPAQDCRGIVVTCTCLRDAELEPIGMRRKWGEGEAYGAWMAHVHGSRS
jgi:hypothetical protein